MKYVYFTIVAVVFPTTSSLAVAQFRLDIEKLADDPMSETANVIKAVHDLVPPPGRGRIRIRNIDGLLMGRRSTATTAQALQRELRNRIDLLEVDCELTEEQTAKLWLAGNVDIAAIRNEIEELARHATPQQINKILQRVSAISRKVKAGFFSDDSMLSKVIKHTLASEQTENQRANVDARIKFAYLAAIDLAISELEKMSALTSHQRQKLVDSLKKTQPSEEISPLTYYSQVLLQLSVNEQLAVNGKVGRVILNAHQRKGLEALQSTIPRSAAHAEPKDKGRLKK